MEQKERQKLPWEIKVMEENTEKSISVG